MRWLCVDFVMRHLLSVECWLEVRFGVDLGLTAGLMLLCSQPCSLHGCEWRARVSTLVTLVVRFASPH